MLDNGARGQADFGHAINAGLNVRIVRIAQLLAGLDEEIDDLGSLDVEQRRQLGARMDQRIEIKAGRGEADAKVAAALDQFCAFDDFALNEEGCRIGCCCVD